MKACESAARFLEAWFAGDTTSRQPWLVLGGQTGTGKTLLAKRAYLLASAHSIDALFAGGWGSLRAPGSSFWPWPRICAHDARDFDDCEHDARTVSLLVLDDIGAESDGYKNNESLARLLRVLSLRGNKFTLVTTNIPRERWVKVYDQRISDRLMTAAYVNMFAMDSYRLERKRA